MHDDVDLIRTIHAAIRRARQEGRSRGAQIDRAVKSVMAVRRDLSSIDALSLVEVVQRRTCGAPPSPAGSQADSGQPISPAPR